MITSFHSNPLGNMAGNKAFQFIPYNLISTLPPASQQRVITALTFNAGSDWLDGYSTINELNFNEPSVKDDSGTLHDVQVTGFVPGNSPELQLLMHEMEGCRHLVKVEDHSGMLRLVGYKAPLEFTASFGSGKVAGADTKGYNFIFYTQTHIRSPFFMV